MNTSSTRVIGIFTVLASLAAPACKEDPPPPPPLPTATAEPRAAHPKAVSGQVQRMSPEATKLYRVDMCFFGSQGLRHLSDAYVASLGGKPPSATNLPEFGDYPQPQVPPRVRAENEAQKAAEPAGDEPKKADEGATAKRKVPGKPDAAGKTGAD